MAERCQQLAAKWSKASDDNLDGFTSEDLEGLSAGEVKEFLAGLLEEVRTCWALKDSSVSQGNRNSHGKSRFLTYIGI